MNLLGCHNKREFQILSFHPTTQVAVARATWWPALVSKRQLPPILIGAPLLLSRMRLTDPRGFRDMLNCVGIAPPCQGGDTNWVCCPSPMRKYIWLLFPLIIHKLHMPMASISEPKSSFSENYAKGNIDTTCDFKTWILCKEPSLTLSLTPVL